jgi:hypothetical protein
MQSAMTSLLVICGITWYGCTVSYFDYPEEIAWYYWLMLASVIPFFIRLMVRRSGNFFHFHSWFLALSLVITLAMFNQSDSNSTFIAYSIFIAYMSLFSLFVLIGETWWFSEGKMFTNAFLVTGSLGSTILLLTFTFKWLWEQIARTPLVAEEAFLVASLVSFLAGALLIYCITNKGAGAINPKSYIFLVFILLFGLGRFQPEVTQWLTNVLVLAIAVLTTWQGAGRGNIIVLNYGLIIMAVLVICRFFDTDLSFIMRGILFMVVGLSFFAANYWFLKKRKLQNV